MTGSPVLREKIYRAYLEFFEVAETKRRWNIFNDVPWEALDSSTGSERKAACIETFCAEELYLPDYSAGGVELSRSMFGAAWFQACWSYEESKHGLVLREYLTRSGLRSEAEFSAFEERVFSKSWRLPFQTRRQMACYGALQEAATFVAYKAQKDKAVSEGDKVLEAIFFLLSRDEAAHAGFYRAAVELELDEDRSGTLTDLAYVIANFKMPGDGLIPDYQERLRTTGAGISARTFMERALIPTLRTLGTSRAELKAAMAQLSAGSTAARPALAPAPAK
ncbi:MAG TPA: acyl-ACP desaturase [Candidatus Binataceae bacterium]|nr:acyl-ACP desaturase [Candidatus Binataceae bacterium]